MISRSSEFELRPAVLSDANSISACAYTAYRHYVDRIGKPPAPMLASYDEIIATAQVWVADKGGLIMGFVVLRVSDGKFLLDNVAVDPQHRGSGIGKALIQLAEAEAKRQKYRSVHLYTHEQMVENQALYARNGYNECDRRTEHGFARVFMRKYL